jgi:thiamine-phosphate pyrophosphorylase
LSKVDFRLYLITDRRLCRNQDLLPVVKRACAAGVRAVQLREKDWPARQTFEVAAQIKALCNTSNTKLFINDRADIAAALGADGVHLTSQSLSVHIVRTVFPNNMLVGTSTHSAEEAIHAESDGADFIVFGPVFPTPSKWAYGPPQGLDRLKETASKVRIPVFAIGGIDPARAELCKKYGAWGVAVISSILSADNIHEKVREFEKTLESL